MIQYVLDTSALITYIENEAGMEQVELLLLKALNHEVKLLI